MKRFLLPIFFVSIVFAKEETSVLLPLKNEIKELKIKSIEEKQKVNQYDWLSHIDLSVSQSKDNENFESKDYSLSLNQEVYNFGGISAKIDYANYLFSQEALKIQMDNQDDLYLLYSNIINLLVNNLTIKQNILNVKNKEIEVSIKKSQYKNGESDISDLNDAIMTKNLLEDTKMELMLEKVKYQNEIKKLTSYDISNINLPDISLISKKEFLDKSSQKQYAQMESKISQTQYQKTKSSYLPSFKINGTAGYNNSDTNDNVDDYYKYGASVSIPLSLKSSNDIQHSKLVFLQNKKEEDLTYIKLEKIYETSFETIKQYEQRINLAQNDIKLYEELLQLNQEEYAAGFKAIEDVDTLKNSKEIRQLDIEKYKLYIKKEILFLYFQIS
ncbi:MAG: TolC family protein [Campylobacterales bacterium]|nr:TolC family protein [Campylobacterales bacterium]